MLQGGFKGFCFWNYAFKSNKCVVSNVQIFVNDDKLYYIQEKGNQQIKLREHLLQSAENLTTSHLLYKTVKIKIIYENKFWEEFTKVSVFFKSFNMVRTSRTISIRFSS
jgi:hypothetical protein